MAWLRFTRGWLVWHVRAGWFYFKLALRLYFAVGLERDFHPGQGTDMGRHFKFPLRRNYHTHLKTGWAPSDR